MMTTYQWHPIWTPNDHPEWNLIEFKSVMNKLNQFKLDLCIRASDYPKNNNDMNNIYEINIYSVYHPYKHVESYWNIDKLNIKNWWPSDDDIKQFQKYGWEISKLYDL